jgi:hypothetical protein
MIWTEIFECPNCSHIHFFDAHCIRTRKAAGFLPLRENRLKIRQKPITGKKYTKSKARGENFSTGFLLPLSISTAGRYACRTIRSAARSMQKREKDENSP